MGSISIERVERACSMSEAFVQAQENDEIEFGSDSYNGGINHCELVADWTHKYNGKNLEKLLKEALDFCSKREAVGICLEKPKPNTNKVKSKVDNVPQKGTRKWDTVYQGVKRDYLNGQGFIDTVVVEGKTQTECLKKARTHCEKTKESLEIVITKKLVSGNRKCATVSYKPSSSESSGKYIFVAWAPY